MEFIHDYYIVESLDDKDINNGKILYDSLKSINKFNPVYIKIYNLNEFKSVMVKFCKSGYKYLFLSAHGDEENFFLTNGQVNAYDLLDIEINLDKRRIFLSTCEGGSFLFGKYFIKKGAYSVIGTPDKLNQIVAAGMWPTMLVIFEKLNNGVINFSELDKTLKLLANVYELNLVYYSFIRNKKSMKEYNYQYNNKRIKKEYPI